MAAQWPLVVSRLVALLPTLPGWSGVSVFDGPPVTGANPSNYITVGFVADAPAGSASSTESGGGPSFSDELGQVVSQLVVNSGKSDVTAARAQAFALYDALDASVKADRTLGGVLKVNPTSGLAYDVHYISNKQGVAVALVITLAYQTTT